MSSKQTWAGARAKVRSCYCTHTRANSGWTKHAASTIRKYTILLNCDMSICQRAIFIPQSHLMSLVLVAWGKQYETGQLGSCWKGSHAAVAGRQAAASMLLRHENSCSLTCVLWDPSLNLSFTIQMILWLLNLRNALRNPHFLLGTWFMSWFWLASGTTEEPDHIPPSHFWWLDLGGRKGRLFQSIFPQLPPMSAKWVFKCAKLAPGKKKIWEYGTIHRNGRICSSHKSQSIVGTKWKQADHLRSTTASGEHVALDPF